MKLEVLRVPAASVVPIRWQVLRPGFPQASAVFDGDDLGSTHHFAAYAEGTMVGVASTYLVPCPELPADAPARQLRGMATLPSARGVGFGRKLLDACVAAARSEGVALIWCNARVSAVPFYEKHGWKIVGAEFDIPTVGPHFRMTSLLAPH